MSQPTGTGPDQTTSPDSDAAALADVVARMTGTTLADEAYDLLQWADRLTTEELAYLMGLAGRTSGPLFLEEALAEDKVTAETVAALIGDVWSSAEFPDQHHDHDTWRWLFDTAGFTVDGKRAPRPVEPLTLYRGSVPERRTDWSWTRDVKVAEKFAAGSPNRPPSCVWVCTVPPSHMLAMNTGRDEDEVVVDTRGLQITERVQ
ncbi:hypothetical protein AB0C88_16155 [Streptomyces chartreusis]|uniref:hypothetical protein n=1 Tax=Streptomyces chartreusis TaxID=1969 RepID=UPI0034010CA1